MRADSYLHGMPWRCRLFGHKRGKALMWFNVSKKPLPSGLWACKRCGRTFV